MKIETTTKYIWELSDIVPGLEVEDKYGQYKILKHTVGKNDWAIMTYPHHLGSTRLTKEGIVAWLNLPTTTLRPVEKNTSLLPTKGSKVRCINDTEFVFDVPNVEYARDEDGFPLQKDHIYTLNSVTSDRSSKSGICVSVDEIDDGTRPFDIARFELA